MKFTIQPWIYYTVSKNGTVRKKQTTDPRVFVNANQKIKRLLNKYNLVSYNNMSANANRLGNVVRDKKLVLLNHSISTNAQFSIREHTFRFSNSRNKADVNTFYNNLTQFVNRHKQNADSVRITVNIVGTTSATSTKILNANNFSLSRDLPFFKALSGSEQLSSKMNSISDLLVTVVFFDVPRGGSSDQPLPFYLSKKTGLLQVSNKDDLCGQRCLLLGMKEVKRQKRYLTQKKFNTDLKTLCDNIQCHGVMQVTDFEKMTDLGYRVVVLQGVRDVMYKTNKPEESKGTIYIHWDSIQEHYNLIQNIDSFVDDLHNNNFSWCSSCESVLNRFNKATHNCGEGLMNKCFRCNGQHSEEKKWTHCLSCNLRCMNGECLDLHETNKCINRKKPKGYDLNKWYYYGGRHNRMPVIVPYGCRNEVKDSWCETCKAFKPEHRCILRAFQGEWDAYHELGLQLHYKETLQKELSNEERRNMLKLQIKEYETSDAKAIEHATGCFTYMCFDFESRFETNEHGFETHVVNYVIVKKMFDPSAEYFEFFDLDSFIEFMLEQKKTVFIAHNGKAYDTWMVYQRLIHKQQQKPSRLILAGNKVMYMKFKSNTFIDSVNHVASPLSKLPKIFGLPDKFKKGFFPYLFNTKENERYVGSIPDRHYFDPEGMSKETYEEFNTWYAKQTGVYDFWKELSEYCKSDVDILCESMERYVLDNMKLNGMNPLKKVTIAGYAMAVYKALDMPLDKPIYVLTRKEYEFCRRGMRGGRTENIAFSKTWKPNKEGVYEKYGAYIDVCSMYPTVQYYDLLPYGVPQWHNTSITENCNQIITDMFSTDKVAYIECDVKCPDDLYVPILCCQEEGKLKATLCNKEKEVFTSQELLLAIEKGYVVSKIHRMLSFTASRDLFKSYVSRFIQIKDECDGWREGRDFKTYQQECIKRFGYNPIVDNFIKNPGKRSIAKMMLNSLWGKFGQNPDSTLKEWVDPSKFWKLYQLDKDKKIEITGQMRFTSRWAFVQYHEKDDSKTSLSSTNIALAGMVTSNARNRLYEVIGNVGERCLYYDTDSCIYEHDIHKQNPVMGEFLGEWTDELDGGKMIEYCGLAPKTYAYKNLKPDGSIVDKIKCKGFTLNVRNSRNINMSLYQSMTENHELRATVNFLNFDKNVKTGLISSVPMEKVLSFGYDKRHIVNNERTLPFGHREIKSVSY